MNTTGDTRGHEDAAEAACQAAAAAAGKTSDQADNCEDGEHKCPVCPWRREPKCPECGTEMEYDPGEPWDGPSLGCAGCGYVQPESRATATP